MDFVIKYWIEFAFGLICGAITFVVKRLCTKIKRQNERQKYIEKGVQALLKDRLIERYRQFKKVGEISILDKESIDTMYKEYKNLGGNGAISQLIEEIQDLPTKLVD